MSFPPSWREVGLLDICELNPRALRPAPEVLVSFYPSSALGDLDGQSPTANIRPYGETSSQGALFQEGDVLIATRGRDVMQARIMSGLTTEFGVAQHFLALRPGPQVLPAFLLHFIQQPWLKQAALDTNRGTQSQLSIPLSFFRNLRMHLPPLDEQAYLVDLLQQASLRPYEEALHKAAHLSDALALELLVSGAKAQSWPRVTMSSICKFRPPRRSPSESRRPARVRLFTPESIDRATGQVQPAKVKFETLRKSCIEVQANDVLFTLAEGFGESGSAFVVPKEKSATPFASSAFQVLRPNNKVLPEYLACFMGLSWLGKQVQSISDRGMVSRSLFERMELALPPLAQQRVIVDLLNKVPRQQLHDAQEKARMLASAMLTEAFSASLSRKWRSQRRAPKKVAPQRVEETPRPGSRQAQGWATPAQRTARARVAAQLSVFQARVWEALSNLPFALLIDDQDAVDAFCRHPLFNQETPISEVSLRRALEQITALGLIRKVGIPGAGGHGDGRFMTAFRACRLNASGHAEEDSRGSDLKRFTDNRASSDKGQ
ncbi:MAG: restriction endonuclease subunit S [Pseudomonas protegens]